MHLRSIVSITASFLVISVAPALAQEAFRLIPDVNFFLGMESHYIWLTGETLVPAGGRVGSGATVDAPNDLGVDQGEGTSITFQADFFDTHRFDADYLLFSPTAVRKLSKTIIFHNQTYVPGSTLEARIEFNWLRFAYGYKVLDSASWQLFPRVGAHYIRCSQTLNGESKEAGVNSNSRTLDGIYPVLGFQVQYAFPYGFDAGFELEGVHLITRGYLAMSRVKAQWTIHPDITLIFTGWDRLALYLEDQQPLNNEWRYNLAGWSAGIAFRF